MQNSMNKSQEKSENIVKIHSDVFTNAIKAMSGEAKSFTPQTLLDMNKVCIVKKDGTLEGLITIGDIAKTVSIINFSAHFVVFLNVKTLSIY